MTIYDEFDELHRDCMARVNAAARNVAKMLAELELMKGQLHAAITIHRTGTGDGDRSYTRDDSEATETGVAPMQRREEHYIVAHG